jgi:hypothetical protein
MISTIPKKYEANNSLFSLLESLEIEKETCLLEVSSKEGEGFLYFFEGKIVDALYEDYEGEQAVHKILFWENVKTQIRDVVRKEQSRPNIINKPLSVLLKELTKLTNQKIPIKHNLSLVPVSESTENETNITRTVDEVLNNIQETIHMGNINECLNDLMKVDGAMAASVVDAKSGMALGSIGSGLNLDLAAAGNSEVMKAKLKTMHSLGLKDRIEDILITLGQQYHLIRPLANAPNLFIYFVLNRAQSNLAMARFKLGELEGRLEV